MGWQPLAARQPAKPLSSYLPLASGCERRREKYPSVSVATTDTSLNMQLEGSASWQAARRHTTGVCEDQREALEVEQRRACCWRFLGCGCVVVEWSERETWIRWFRSVHSVV